MTARSKEDLALAVKQGAYFLDEHIPGWRQFTTLESFDISMECRCVLGQVCGRYTLGLSKLKLSSEEAQELGFDWKFDPEMPMFDPRQHAVMEHEYRELQRLWKNELQK
jgi:hypothetical protein